MSRKKVDPDTKTRIQVVASSQQAQILAEAAQAAGCSDRSTWILAHAMKAAKAEDSAGAPLVVTGVVADRLRAEAERQGITPDQVLEQMLIAG